MQRVSAGDNAATIPILEVKDTATGCRTFSISMY